MTARALRGRFIRTILTVAGVGATSMLVILLLATHRSLTTGVNTYLNRSDIDLWVTPRGTDNLIRTSGLLNPFVEERWASEAGIARFSPILRSFVAAQPLDTGLDEGSNDKRLTLLAIGYNIHDGLGGPPDISDGRMPENSFEAALDRSAAHRLRVVPGDSILVNGRALYLAGLTRGTNLLATQFLFVDITYLWDIFGIKDQVSFIVIQATSGTDPDSVASFLKEQYPDADYFSSKIFVENNLREVASGLLPILGLVAIMGISVAAVLVLLLIQGLVEDRRSDIAVLLALGNGTGVIGAGLIARAAFLVLFGTLFGGGLATVLVGILDQFAPHIEFTYTADQFWLVCALFVPIGMLAAAVPLLRLHRIDPLEVFRA